MFDLYSFIKQSLPGFKSYFRQRTTSVHMKEPRIRLDRQADVIPVVATMMNLICVQYGLESTSRQTYSASPDFGFCGSWGTWGWGWWWPRIWRRRGWECSSGKPALGVSIPRTNDKHAAMKDTSVACTWSRAMFPNRIEWRLLRSSRSPTFAYEVC